MLLGLQHSPAMRVINIMPLRRPLPLTVATMNCVKTLQDLLLTVTTDPINHELCHCIDDVTQH
jgi:hypothetical protein